MKFVFVVPAAIRKSIRIAANCRMNDSRIRSQRGIDSDSGYRA